MDKGEKAKMLSRATVFDLSDGITIEKVQGSSLVVCWAIRNRGTGHVLNVGGEWEYEPQPSSRSVEFLKRTRFDFETAWKIGCGSMR